MFYTQNINDSFKYLLVSRAMRSVALIFTTLALPLYLKALGYRVETIGIFYFAIILINAFIVLGLGNLGDRVGYKKILIIAELLPLIGLLMLSSSTTLSFILIAAVLCGVSGTAGGARGAMSPGSTALIASNWRGQRARINKISKINLAASSFAILGGMLLSIQNIISLSIGDINAFKALYLLCAIFILISLISLFLVKEVKRPKKQTKFMKKGSTAYSLRILLPNLINGAGIGIVIPLLPLWLALKYDASAFTIGLIFSVSYIATSLASYSASKIKYKNNRYILKFATYTRTFQGLSLILIAFIPYLGIAAALLILRTFVAGIGMPSRAVTNIKNISNEDYGTATTMQGMGSRFSQTTSGLSGYLMELSLSSPLVIGGVLQTISAFVYFKLVDSARRRI
ncbi:MFS transporter [Candidatus Marsarchaeota archaeon]|nr:MFS transporter [Candidatus Marsarchaeota archaeon]